MTVSHQMWCCPPGYAQRITITTAGSAPVQVGPYDGRVLTVTLADGVAELTGKAVGACWSRFALPYRSYVAVSVRPPAGEIPAEAEVVVTGTPATPETIREAVERRMQEVVKRDPGATLDVGAVTAEPVPAGETATVPVEVTVPSPFGGPVGTVVQVRVTNEAIDLADPVDPPHEQLGPETIRDNGWLFNETLSPGRPTRLLYHHANGTPGQVRRTGTHTHEPGRGARPHSLSQRLAGQSPDSIFIGFVSTQRFLDALVGQRGYIVRVQARTVYDLYCLYAVTAGARVRTDAGRFQVVEGGPIELLVHVRVPYLLDSTVTKDLGPGCVPHPRGSFPSTVLVVAKDLTAPQGGVIADLGVMANLQDPRTFEPLVGDYGVLYRIKLRLSQHDHARGVHGAQRRQGGRRVCPQGCFLVNGKPVDVG